VQASGSSVMQQLNLVIANQYELIREKFRLKYNGQSLSQIVHSCSSQGLSTSQILSFIQETRTSRRLCESQTIQDQQAQLEASEVDQKMASSAQQENLTKSQKKRKRKKLQEQMKKQEQPEDQQHDGEE